MLPARSFFVKGKVTPPLTGCLGAGRPEKNKGRNGFDSREPASDSFVEILKSIAKRFHCSILKGKLATWRRFQSTSLSRELNPEKDFNTFQVLSTCCDPSTFGFPHRTFQTLALNLLYSKAKQIN